ncbi:MAG: HepT-like ribonuclease domain-containing protein [Opitutaceae bacterium]
MTPDANLRLLRQALDELAAARRHLDFSSARISSLPADLKSISEAQLESAEAYTSRSARTVDLLVNKVLRGIDRVELRPGGTLLDVINGAEQRGLIDRAESLREMKAMRNEVAHDYAGQRLPEVFAFCRERKPLLDAICDRAADYAGRLR